MSAHQNPTTRSRRRPTAALAIVFLSLSLAAAAAAASRHSASPAVIVACEHRDGGGLYIARRCLRHDRRLRWNIAGRAGSDGAPGAPGAQGATGAAGPSGPQGPGAVEYSYTSTAPAASEQDTPLGPAGPFQELTASCTVSGSIVSVVLGASNTDAVTYDETRVEVTNGGTPETSFQTQTQPASTVPADLLGESNTTSAGDGYNQTSLIVTSPSHGSLEVFEHVSHASNTCHLSVVWTPAG